MLICCAFGKRQTGSRLLSIYPASRGFPRPRSLGRYLLVLSLRTAEPLAQDTEVEFELVEYYQDGWVFDRTTTTRHLPCRIRWRSHLCRRDWVCT